MTTYRLDLILPLTKDPSGASVGSVAWDGPMPPSPLDAPAPDRPDLRDAAAMLLAHLLPCPEARPRRGARPHAPAALEATAPPDGRRLPRLPSTRQRIADPAGLSKQARWWRAHSAELAAERATRSQATRAALGCTCAPRGRRSSLCPAYALHVAAGAARRTPSS